MLRKKETALTPMRAERDPFVMLRQMTEELYRVFDEPLFGWRRPFFRTFTELNEANWWPAVDVFERDNQLVTTVELPGLKKNDIKVEVTDGYLVIAGERKIELEDNKKYVYRCYRAVPLPEDAKPEVVKATFADGVLEVNIPLAVLPKEKVRTVEIEERPKRGKHAA